MATPWDAPPTPQERAAAGWDTPPTPEEIDAARPRVGMGDVQAAASSFAGTGNVPVSWLTGDADTDARIAQNLAAQGYRHNLTKADALKAGAVAAGALVPELIPGVLGAAAGGGFMSAGLSDADSAAGRLFDATTGALVGYGTAKALPYIGQAAKAGGKALLRVITPKVTPTPEAARLVAQGVPLTTGQLQPSSVVNVVEQATDRAPLGVGAARDAAVDAWRGLPMRQALAPGQTLPDDGVAAQLEALHAGFRPQYAPISAQPVEPVNVAQMPARILAQRGGIDARTKAAAAREVKNALTVLPQNLDDALPQNRIPVPVAVTQSGTAAEVSTPVLRRPSADGYPMVRETRATPGVPPQPSRLVGGQERLVPQTTTPAENTGWGVALAEPPPMPNVTAGDVMKVRSVIREQIRAAIKAQDFDRLRLLEAAEAEVTGTLGRELSPQNAQALSSADKRYAIYKVLQDAAARAGLTGEFTPKQLGAAIKAAEGRASFAEGGGRELRQLADDANAVFSPTIPMTGKAPFLVSAIPGKLVAPLARAAQFPAVRSAMLREPISVSPAGSASLGFGQATSRVVSPRLQAFLDAMASRGRVGLTPAMAENEQESK